MATMPAEGFATGYQSVNFAIHNDAPEAGDDLLSGGDGRDWLSGGGGVGTGGTSSGLADVNLATLLGEKAGRLALLDGMVPEVAAALGDFGYPWFSVHSAGTGGSEAVIGDDVLTGGSFRVTDDYSLAWKFAA